MNNDDKEVKLQDSLSSSVNQVLPEKSVAQPLEDSIVEGINLIPKKTQEEVKVENKKATFNIGSVLGLIGLVVLSMGIVAFNIISKTQLNNKKNELFKYENVINQKSDLIVANNSIVNRFVMYNNIEKGRFSHKDIVDFLTGIMKKGGNTTLRTLTISDTLQLEFAGEANSFEEVSKLWYLLGVNENIETVNLESVGKTDNGANFNFTAQLVMKGFIK